MKVLVVDDEAPIRGMMRLALEAAGYEVGEASRGEEALTLYDDAGPWDAVVLDQRMPGLDGLETLRRLRARDPDARVLMVTAYASVELAVDAMKYGARDFVRKPMTPETLRSAVAAVLAHGRAPGRPATITSLTMNGFRIDRAGVDGPRHLFRVGRFPDGPDVEVAVVIGEEAFARVRRLTRRDLPSAGGFWSVLTERTLADYLWSEGGLPPGRSLPLDDVTRDDLEVAAAWKEPADRADARQ